MAYKKVLIVRSRVLMPIFVALSTHKLYKAQTIAHESAIKSPNGFNSSFNELKEIQAIPIIARIKPRIRLKPSFCLRFLIKAPIATKIGAVETIKLTFDALDRVKAVFSATKYRVIPKRPDKAQNSSPLKEVNFKALGRRISSARVAITNLSNRTSIGVKSSNNT